jgi:DNA modification methylase
MELTTSIAEIGLLHAPVVRETPEGLTLVSGERRLRAIEDLFMLGHSLFYNNKVIEPGSVPYVTLGELSFLEAEEAELDENLKRRDLTWQELAAAHERLHKLRQKQVLAQPHKTGEPAVWTTADTAKELSGRSDGAYQDKVRRELIVAKHLGNPEIQKAKTVDEAFKLLKQQENRERNIALAEETGKTFSSAIHEVKNFDCLKWMEVIVEGGGELVDVICTDPPYGMGADTFGNAAGKLSGIEHHYDDSYEAWYLLMEAWCPLSYQVCKPQAHAYVFCDIDNFPVLKTLMQQAGWYVFRTPFICVKPNSGRVPLPDQGPRRQYETLLYAIKGKKPVTHIYPDVISTTADEQLSHGAQKPVALFKNLLQRSVLPGDTVLDCFAGTGPIIPAAHHFQCQAIVLEKEKEYYAICCERLKALEEGE